MNDTKLQEFLKESEDMHHCHCSNCYKNSLEIVEKDGLIIVSKACKSCSNKDLENI